MSERQDGWYLIRVFTEDAPWVVLECRNGRFRSGDQWYDDRHCVINTIGPRIPMPDDPPAPQAAPSKIFDPEFLERNSAFVAAMPDWAKGSPVNKREPALQAAVDLEALKALCDAATPGPLSVEDKIRIGREGGKHGYREISAKDSACWIARVQAFTDGPIDKASAEWLANAELFVAARTAMPALIHEVESLRARVADHNKAMRGIAEACTVFDPRPGIKRICKILEPFQEEFIAARAAPDAAREKGGKS